MEVSMPNDTPAWWIEEDPDSADPKVPRLFSKCEYCGRPAWSQQVIYLPDAQMHEWLELEWQPSAITWWTRVGSIAAGGLIVSLGLIVVSWARNPSLVQWSLIAAFVFGALLAFGYRSIRENTNKWEEAKEQFVARHGGITYDKVTTPYEDDYPDPNEFDYVFVPANVRNSDDYTRWN